MKWPTQKTTHLPTHRLMSNHPCRYCVHARASVCVWVCLCVSVSSLSQLCRLTLLMDPVIYQGTFFAWLRIRWIPSWILIEFLACSSIIAFVFIVLLLSILGVLSLGFHAQTLFFFFLLVSLPGPRWASWNLGIFVCIRCAGIHRNLGVHISKVKSVNLDQWTQEQVQVSGE